MKSFLKFTIIMAGIAMVLVLVIAVLAKRDKATLIGESPKIVPSPTVVPIRPLKFGVMADVHMNWEEWKDFLEISKERGEEFVIIAGDLTSLGKRNELVAAKKVLDESGVRYYVVPGNHDLWEGERIGQELFNDVFGKDYQSFKIAEVKFILVNNGSKKGLGDTQKIWLEGEVDECKFIKCIAVMHMPLNHNFSEHVMGESVEATAAEARKLIALFNSNNVKDVLTGHLHYSTSYELEGVRTTIVGAVNRARNTQSPRYTEFLKKGEELESEVVMK